MSLKQSLGKPKRLRTCKKQLLGLLNLFLSLRVEFVHSGELLKKGRRIVAVRARLSNQMQQLRFENRASAMPNLWIAELGLLSFVLSCRPGWCRIRCRRGRRVR